MEELKTRFERTRLNAHKLFERVRGRGRGREGEGEGGGGGEGEH